jgi:hypothetical protein
VEVALCHVQIGRLAVPAARAARDAGQGEPGQQETRSVGQAKGHGSGIGFSADRLELCGRRVPD